MVVFINLKGFLKSRKNWRFSWPRTCEKMSFLAFHKLAYFSPKWTNIYILSVLWSTGGSFHHFERLSGKSKKLKFFMTADLREKCHFWAFHKLAYFSPKWTNIYISSVLGSTMVVFINLKGFLKSRKNWRFSWPRTCEKNVIFGHFTNLHISHPKEQIFTFQVSWGQLMVVFINLKGFLKSRKNWRFSWPRTCEKVSFLGISQTCIFFIQMSKY